MRANVRRDLKDDDAASYRWSDDEIDRHIGHAVRDFSEAMPLAARGLVPTIPYCRVIDISALADRVMVEGVEYPLDRFPPSFQRFALWGQALTLLGDELPDGADCAVYYGVLHTLNASGSTIPAIHEDLVAAGAAGYAAVEWAGYAINRVSVGGTGTPDDFLKWGQARLAHFKAELKRLGRRNQVRVRRLYRV